MSSSESTIPEGFRLTHVANGWVRIAHPVSWNTGHGESYSTIEDPEGAASLGLVVALRAQSTLPEFAEVCCQLAPPFKAISERTAAAGPGWMEGVFQDFLDPTAEEPEDTTRRILCVRSNDLYAKITFYCHQRWLGSDEYSQIVESIVVEGMRVVTAP